MKRALLTVVLAAVLLALPSSAPAHPHVFVEPEMVLVFDGRGLAGVRHVWIFDEMFTVYILQDYDLDGNYKLSPDEITVLKEGAFDNISEWGWFTYLTVGGKPYKPAEVTEFTARMDGGALVYEFFVPCSVDASTGRMTVSVFDPDYFVDFLPPLRQSVSLEGAEGFNVSLSIAEDPGAIFSEWMITPTKVAVEFNTK